MSHNRWIAADYYFDNRFTVFHVRPDTELFQLLHEALVKLEGEPAALETFLRFTIISRRPELVGCVIHYFGLDMASYRFMVGVSHECLPRQKMGSMGDIKILE